MFTNKVMLPAGAPLPDREAIRVIHTYPNGDRLIEVKADGAAESLSRSSESVRSGLRLPPRAAGSESRMRTDWSTMDPEREVLAFIELIGPVDAQWLKELEQDQIRILRYQPNHCYLCSARPAHFRAAMERYFVEAVTVLDQSMKPVAELEESGASRVMILYVSTPGAAQETTAQLSALAGVEIDEGILPEAIDFYLRIPARITGEGHDLLLNDPRVVSIENLEEASPEGEMANLILAGAYSGEGIPEGDYLEWLEENQLDGSGVGIAIVDTGIDADHPAFNGRINDRANGKKGWHGTFVAGCAAGDYREERDTRGYLGGLGVAPKADIIAIDKSGVTSNPAGKARDSVRSSGPNGARAYVQNNSWGAGTRDPMNYSSLEATYDQLVRNADPDNETARPLVICFSSGNRGRRGLTRPKAAKNVIVTGNSENYQEKGGAFGNNIDDVYFDESWQPSSLGNCGDQRIRPHLVAPGEWTLAPNFGMKPGNFEYFSQALTWCGGSSAASPKTAGACSLLVQWWRQHQDGSDPSPAMVRALLVNGAERMPRGSVQLPDGTIAREIPNKLQGWGRLNVANIVDTAARRVYLDQSVLLRSRAEEWSAQLVPVDPAKPVKITLAWTDPPGNLFTGDSIDNPAIVNRLNLKLEVEGTIYHGNHFDRGWSVAGELPDDRLKGLDNTQNIFLPAGTLRGAFKVAVEALEITTNCFDFAHHDPQQDFALVIDNAQLDTEATDSEVFVLVDETPADDTSDAEYPENGNQDEEEVWYWEAESGDGGETQTWWFSEDDFDWYSTPDEEESTAESATRPGRGPLEVDPHLLQIGRQDNAVQILGQDSETTTVEVSRRDQAVPDLLSTLNKLAQQWNDTPAGRPKTAVIRLNRTSRIEAEALSLIRQLCFTGKIYFVSDDAALLLQLMQQIKRKEGLQLRYAADPADLDRLFRETLAEAGGGQAVKVHYGRLQVGGGAFFNAYGADVIQPDRRLSFYLQTGGAARSDLQLLMPGGDRIPLSFSEIPASGQVAEGIDVIVRERSVLIRVDLENKERGRYILLSPEGQALELNIWTASAPCWTMNIGPENTVAEEDPLHKRRLLTVRAMAGLQFKRMQVTKKLIHPATGKNGTAESGERTLLEPPLRARSESDGSIGRDTEAQAVAVMSHWLDYRVPEAVPYDVQMEVQIEGRDVAGAPFQRILRLDCPNSGSGPILSHGLKRCFRAEVTKKYYADGALRALRLRTALGERDFRITEPAYARWIDSLDLKKYPLEFTVLGSRILFLTQILKETERKAPLS